MKHILILIIGLIFIKSIAQNSELQKENFIFLQKFKIVQTIPEKLHLISEKLNDDLKYVPDSTITYCNIAGNKKFEYKWEINHWQDTDGKPCGKKILFCIFYKKGKYMLELNELYYPGRKHILDLLNDKNIENIQVFDSNFSKVIFGERGSETESIVIYTDDKVIKRFIKKVTENKNYGKAENHLQ